MLKKTLLVTLAFICCGELSFAQKTVRSFIFGHSLIHHELQVVETPSQETSVPHWMHFLSQEAGHNYAVSGIYGFLPQHANLPPSAQWGFDFAIPAWDSDNESFVEANFNNIMITPGNFIQWQGPSENYPNENLSPTSATLTVFDWCLSQNDQLDFYVYENWPEMAPFLSDGFPPTQQEWQAYNENLNSEFHAWFLKYHSIVATAFPSECISFIPVGTLLSNLLSEAPFTEIPITELYEDDAPHGRASLYFLASMVTYMAKYAEKAPSTFIPPDIIHPIITENYQVINDKLWSELLDFHNNERLVFCQGISVSNEEDKLKHTFKVYPNPSYGHIQYSGAMDEGYIKITNRDGKVLSQVNIKSTGTLSIESFSSGLYFINVFDRQHNLIAIQKIVIQ